MNRAPTRRPESDPPGQSLVPLASWYTPERTDGFGDRLLMSDNTGASSLELLRFHPQLATVSGFESALRARVEQRRSFHHPMFPEVRAVEHLDGGRRLALISVHASGRRLSDVCSGPRRIRVHPAVAAWLVRQMAPALAELQRRGGGAHGVLTADRIVLTSDGSIAVVDHALGSALEQLYLPPGMLWTVFGLVAPHATGIGQFDSRSDIIQLALIVLWLTLGRRITPADYPAHIEPLLDEFTDTVGRRAPAVAGPLRLWLERALRASGNLFKSAEDAAEGLSHLPENVGPEAIEHLLTAGPAGDHDFHDQEEGESIAANAPSHTWPPDDLGTVAATDAPPTPVVNVATTDTLAARADIAAAEALPTRPANVEATEARPAHPVDVPAAGALPPRAASVATAQAPPLNGLSTPAASARSRLDAERDSPPPKGHFAGHRTLMVACGLLSMVVIAQTATIVLLLNRPAVGGPPSRGPATVDSTRPGTSEEAASLTVSPAAGSSTTLKKGPREIKQRGASNPPAKAAPSTSGLQPGRIAATTRGASTSITSLQLFTVGSSIADVVRVQGPPGTRVANKTGNIFFYGSAWVKFDRDGKVVSWSDPRKTLKVPR